MNKILSLIKVNLNYDMNIFKINTKKQNNKTKLISLILAVYIMIVFGSYAETLYDKLAPFNLEYLVILLFAIAVSFFTLIEGIYKSSTILFNAKDDNLLFSLPIKRSTVLFIRIFKFYIFELIFNSLFFLPAIIIYASKTNPGISYYITSFFGLILIPVIPVLISSIIGFIISYYSSKFKVKNLFQILISMLFLLIVMYFSFNTSDVLNNIIMYGNNVNNITNYYYPIKEYISLINNFDLVKLIVYIIVHIVIFLVLIRILSYLYFNINSNAKKEFINYKNKKYKIKYNKKSISFIKKELNKFISTPVFVINAGFGIVLFLVLSVLIAIRFNAFIPILSKLPIKINNINSLLSLIVFSLICFGSFMTSITSSMISLEGKSFNLLKGLPIKPIEIILYKVYASLVIIIPGIILGSIILCIKFNFDLITIILILSSSIILPFVTELFGIFINLKYPKLDATNDTEVVKQSMSSFICTMAGMVFSILSISLVIVLFKHGLNSSLIIFIFALFYFLIALLLLYILNKKSYEYFNNIVT